MKWLCNSTHTHTWPYIQRCSQNLYSRLSSSLSLPSPLPSLSLHHKMDHSNLNRQTSCTLLHPWLQTNFWCIRSQQNTSDTCKCFSISVNKNLKIEIRHDFLLPSKHLATTHRLLQLTTLPPTFENFYGCTTPLPFSPLASSLPLSSPFLHSHFFPTTVQESDGVPSSCSGSRQSPPAKWRCISGWKEVLLVRAALVQLTK